MSDNRNQEMNERDFRQMSNDGIGAGNSRSGDDRGGRTASRRGFAAMDPEKQRQIARQGGKAAHQQGVAHQWTTEEARAAGRKGGQNSRGGGRKSER
ncbi:MAG: KGG domain-containing protein [Chitinophagaceae bacterium]